MDLTIDEPFSLNPGILEVGGEDDFVVFFHSFVDRGEDLSESLGSLLFKALHSIVEARFDVEDVSFFILIGVDQFIFWVLKLLILVKLNVFHIIFPKDFNRHARFSLQSFLGKGAFMQIDDRSDKIKIVFTDIDGTLFSHKTNMVPPSAIMAIHELQKKGIKVFLCSGRNYYLIRKSGVMNYFKPDGLVTMNGSNAIIDNNIIYRYPIPAEIVDKMVMFAKKLKFGLTLIEENEGHINLIDDRVIHAHEQFGTRFPQPRTYPDHYDRTVYQMIAFIDQWEEDLIAPQLTGCKTARWDDYAVDIMLKDSDKSKGIMSVLNYFGYKPEEAMCLGDAANDIEMLSYCGTSVAMGNGSDEAKKAATYVTTDIDNDGWANAMKHFGLIKE